jgi:hypothetical protein
VDVSTSNAWPVASTPIATNGFPVVSLVNCVGSIPNDYK